MLKCWKRNKNLRPQFTDLVEYIEEIFLTHASYYANVFEPDVSQVQNAHNTKIHS